VAFVKFPLPLVFLMLTASCSHAQSPVQIYDIKVINTFPHNINAFTQGLVFHQGYLYEGTGQLGRSALSRLNLEDGEVLQSTRLSSRYFGEGIAIVGERIYQLTWQSNIAFVYDLETFKLIESHYHPTEGWGLTYDGAHLILSDGTPDLQFIDPDTFQLVQRVTVTLDGRPLPNLNELEYINGEVWANVWMTSEIVRIDPVSGEIRAVVDLSGLKEMTTTGGRDDVLNGIAWDADRERLFVTGKLWANLFEIELVPRN
jgi:glutaminyl-peptide cyclotransferase